MFKYILPVFLFLSIASCSNDTTVQKPMDSSGSASAPVRIVENTATGFDMKALEILQKQQQQKYDAFA